MSAPGSDMRKWFKFKRTQLMSISMLIQGNVFRCLSVSLDDVRSLTAKKFDGEHNT